MPIIVNTMGASVEYIPYRRIEEEGSLRLMPLEDKKILIHGGQGVIRRGELVTPRGGVTTKVSAQELAELENNCLFRQQRDAGFLTVIGDDARDQDRAFRDMQPEDDSAQLTPEDFAPEAAAAEATGDELKINNRKIRVAEGARVRRSRKRSK